MGDMREIFDAMKEHNVQRKARNLKQHSEAETIAWVKHTEFHWSITVAGKRLDFWPSRNKFQWNGKVMVGDVYGFIRNRNKEFEASTSTST